MSRLFSSLLRRVTGIPGNIETPESRGASFRGRDLKDIYLCMMQFMVIQVIGLVLIFVFPQIALWLPTLIYGE
mgnify:CR=1 FL=1